MIQDIAPHALNNQFMLNKTPAEDSLIYAFKERSLLIRSDREELTLPTYGEWPVDCKFLFQLDGKDCFVCTDDSAPIPEGYEYLKFYRLRGETAGPRHRIFAAYTAEQLDRWMKDNRYCGTCGTKTVIAQNERAIDCPSCGRRIYPRIQPAVIVGVTNGDQILMTKYANRTFRQYALVAGFTEIGETLEETVRREVLEEVGLKVKNIRYYKSQPWAMADDILAGFYCDVDGDPTIQLDKEELKEGIWVNREDVVGQSDDYSLTNEMMMTFKAGKEPR